jgi:uncharacterized protein (DUF3084 family)
MTVDTKLREKITGIAISVLTAGLIGAFGWAWSLNSQNAVQERNIDALESQMKATWRNYNTMLKEKEIMMSEYSKLEQRVEHIEKNKESEDQNNMLQKLFEHKKK